MPAPKDTPVILQRRFDDFDAMTDATRQWDLDFLQLDRGPFEGEVLQADAGSIFFTEGRFSRRLEQRGVAPPGMRTFAVPAHEDVRFIWRGQHVEPTDLLLFPRSGELHAVSQPDFHVFTLSLPESLLYEVAEMRGVSDIDRLFRHEKASCPPPFAIRLRLLLRRFRDALSAGHPLWTAPSVTKNLESEIPDLLIQALDASDSRPCDSMVPRRHQALMRAKDFIAAHEEQPLTVRDLCRAARVSERTLQYAFREHLNVAPKTYLKAVRLNGARKSLRQANAIASTVTDVAAQWGFWHMGQFATDYRKQFGELPSQTLAADSE